jgi:hypothetical protein
MLHHRGYSERDIMELYNFLDWLFNLPKDLEQQLQNELTAFEEANKMKYITSIERLSQQKIALNMLRMNLAPEVIAEATGLTVEQIQQLQVEQQT